MGYLATLGQLPDVIPQSDEAFLSALHSLAVKIAGAREAGNQGAELHWRGEFQRLSNLHSQWKTGQAIEDTALTISDYAPSPFALTFGGGMLLPLAVIVAVLALGPGLAGRR